MKRIPFALLAVALFCALSLAQDQNQPPNSPTSSNQQAPAATPPPDQQAPEPSSPQTPAPTSRQPSSQTGASASSPGGQGGTSQRIAPGSVIPVQLTKTLDAKKAKTGDQVVAKVTQDMKTSSGEVLVPRDTKIVGHVTEAQARTKEQSQSQVGIAFDRAVMRSGEVQLPMSIQAIIAPPRANADNEAGSAGNDQAASTSRGAGGMSGAGRAGATGTTPTGAAGSTPEGNTAPTESSNEGSTQPQITGNTQGVIGISNVKLETAQNSAQGSVVSSEKNNVKLESGTLLLLRVNQ